MEVTTLCHGWRSRFGLFHFASEIAKRDGFAAERVILSPLLFFYYFVAFTGKADTVERPPLPLSVVSCCW